MHAQLRLVVARGVLLALFAAAPLVAQDAAPTAPPAEPAAAAPDGPTLEQKQESIRVRFERFEETLLKMARYLQKTEPARAELVLRALGRSQEEEVSDRMERLAALLSKEGGKSARYADAIEEQEALLANLQELLTILRSEDILDENRKEQERLKELARQVSALIDAEKVHQADTQRGAPTDRVAEAQGKTARRTGDVIKSVDEHDRSRAKQNDSESSEGEGKQGEGQQGENKQGEGSESENKQGEPGEPSEDDPKSPDDGQPGEKEPGEKEPGEKEPGEKEPGEKEPGEKEPGENGEQPSEGSDSQSGDEQSQDGSPSEGQQGQQQQGQQQQGQQQQGQQQQGQQQQGQQQQGQQQQGQQQQGQQQQGQQQEQAGGPPKATPGREELEAAREKMERAIEELKEQNRKNASQAQEEAIQKLIEAKERIEELLRQLREEERELLLRALEARFQKMLQLQQQVLGVTEELSGQPVSAWQDREFARCRDAAATEREIGVEADKALEILRADGSSVAFPEAVEQLRDDVMDVAGRLSREDAGELTVAIERDIVDALEEMILALQKEMEKMREQKGQQPGQQGSPADPSLVDQLAELKMLKTLQLRINRRTKVLGRLFSGEQADEPDVINQLQELAERQGRLQKATYDLAIGKTSN